MNRRFIAAFAAVCIAAALGAAASVAYRVLGADAAGRSEAKADFEGLSSLLSAVKGPADLADPSLRARLSARYEANSRLLLIDIYERGAGDRWRIPSDSPYISTTRTEGAVPALEYPAASTILLSAALKGDNSGRLAVDALYTSLTQGAVFAAFRDALISLGAFLALAALVLAIFPATEAAAPGKGRRAVSAEAEEAAAAAAEYQFDIMESAGLAADTGPETEPEVHAPAPVAAGAPPSRGISIKAPAVAAEDDFDIPVMLDEPAAPVAAATAPAPNAAPAPAQVAGGAETAPTALGCGEEPSGLYSPSSGLGWESYMKDRLDAELSRSASFEQDLSLLAFCHDGLLTEDPAYASIGAAIEKFFSFRDLAFERGDDGFSVILPNIDSNRALRMAEEFYKKLVFLADGDFAELDLLPLFMGISSRGGRLVDAARMVAEAEAALEKARYEKDSRIVAFKPDPDKYRLFLASKGT